MKIYKHITYNPQFTSDKGHLDHVIKLAQEESKEWKFERVEVVTDYEWVAIFSREVKEDSK